MNEELENKFKEWFDELEGFSFRSERFWTDLDWFGKDYMDMNLNLDNPKSTIEYTHSQTRMKEWLRTAYQMGYKEGQRLYGGTE